MDYLKLLKGLKNEFFEAGKAKYTSMNKLLALICTVIFIPLRVGFFFGRLFFWFTWFFFKGLSAPVDYLDKWFKAQKEDLGDIAKAALILVSIPTILFQHVLLAFNSFSFYFQWFGLMLSSYIMTLGAARWQPVVTEATFDEE